ncbi:unnamed protein product [Rhizophagus irregularis]|nr:unnamed protein product [Rhizophagus irregularis]
MRVISQLFALYIAFWNVPSHHYVQISIHASIIAAVQKLLKNLSSTLLTFPLKSAIQVVTNPGLSYFMIDTIQLQ